MVVIGVFGGGLGCFVMFVLEFSILYRLSCSVFSIVGFVVCCIMLHCSCYRIILYCICICVV